MRGFDHATILSPSFHGLRKERLAQCPAFCVPKIRRKIRGGTSREKRVADYESRCLRKRD